MGYSRLTDHERNTIAHYYNKENYSFLENARHLERNVSTISRKIKRNKNEKGIYNPSFAQTLAVDRRRKLKNRSKFSPELREQIEEELEESWPPEQIWKWFRMYGNDFVPAKTIYRYVKKGLVGNVQNLRKKSVPYKRKSDVNRMTGGKGIHERSKEANNQQMYY